MRFSAMALFFVPATFICVVTIYKELGEFTGSEGHYATILEASIGFQTLAGSAFAVSCILDFFEDAEVEEQTPAPQNPQQPIAVENAVQQEAQRQPAIRYDPALQSVEVL